MKLELSHLEKRYGGQAVLSDFSLRFSPRGVTALCGPSGCGKTTLLRLIAGLEKADAGVIAGLDGGRISMIFQEDRLLPWCTAEQNISVAAPKSDAAFWLRQMGLEDAGGKLPDELSGGMRSRVSIARSLAYGGELFLLDEPFKALDDATRMKIIACTMQALGGKPVILVTHELTEAAAMADTVVLLDGPPLRVLHTTAFSTPFSGRGPEQIRRYRRELEEARLR